ncbi:Co2+/Mg2+ efflux protein ApaG [Xylella taiwanensis]|uniref:Protein ApaG n=1 Tax=Xylella taiwanensis TaxID=1444770 RepID=Z9JMX5_9GAMM|nr:Co2+/Mg2+ efflux protein ApaG [Xylella taiwanensis]AXI83314.1 magnesium transporter ApaG [Xylella taiwanensis]EWS79156.1 magnesium transporter ApaG [Xylella taiwanensis]MCD8456385.1 Co2+/Mg2+ efflux protein ApaG [Xylella taiwanensis]MCD8458793.1 Co2+/Mg2+ efflux protein ApaG [Xylella taiwanensis]MCD8460929.1 Co2+/Mg2+ efflux protein ApaG [Xylella taiwanensis]
MQNNPSSQIEVVVSSRFLDNQSNRNEGRYVFAYTIRIYNTGHIAARLIARHWQITDANGKVEYVTGEGVIGEQPRLRPGEEFRYTSGVVLGTEQGQMQGHYDMMADDGTEFTATIAPFVLSVPRTLH